MTAEIGVLNRIGVALAADSAVSIGGDAQKVYSSADKLFQLSESAPVEFMIYGSASFLDVPWETLVKVFRQQLGSVRFSTLVEYVDSFVAFLGKPAPLFTDALEERATHRILRAIVYDFRRVLEQELNSAAEKEDGLNEEEVAAVCVLVAQHRCEQILGRPFLPGFVEADVETARVRAGEMIAELSKEAFGALPFTPERLLQLHEALVSALIRSYTGPFVSGLVFAGFGEDEYFPCMYSVEIEERVLGGPRIAKRKTHSLESTDALVVPFAQRDAVASFLEGVDPGLQAEMRTSVSVLFEGAFVALTAELSKTDPAGAAQLDVALKPGLEELLKRLFAGWENMRRQHWRPVVEMVGVLPKDELASVAEALVNLTKFRRRVTPVTESVGGPIDVALITKGDGFVWIKRKHYFQPELNPRAVQRLAGGGR